MFHRLNARDLVKKLEGKIDAGLLCDLELLVGWRNFLAHSYLVARLAPDGGATLSPTQDHLDELAELGEAFQAAVLRIEAEIRTIAGTVAAPEVQDSDKEAAAAFREWVVARTSTLVFQEPERFSP